MTPLPALKDALPSAGSEGVPGSSGDVFLREVATAPEEPALKSGREPSLSRISW